MDDLKINLRAADISREIVEFAEAAVYSFQNGDNEGDSVKLATYRDQLPGFSPFKFMTESEKNEMFDGDGEFVKVKSWIKKDISWYCADAGDPELQSILGPPGYGDCESIPVPYGAGRGRAHFTQHQPCSQAWRAFVCVWRRP